MNIPEKLRVLVPLDGSDFGESALLAIQPLLSSGPVSCTLLHVTESEKPSPEVDAHLKMHRDELEKVRVSTRIRMSTGRPTDVILGFAASGEFDLVAMSTHGRRGLDHMKMGSVAEDVVRSSTVPTVLCRKGTPSSTWDKILVALDGQPEAEEILEDVLLLAPRVGATVHLLQVSLGLVPADPYRGVSTEVPPAPKSDYLDTVGARLAGSGISVITDHCSGMAAKEIALVAEDLGAGLICMTTRGLPEEPPGLSRSVAAEVIRQAPCPVYVRRMSQSSCRTR